jgi:DNA-binding transcriptional LysR family regulator
MVDLLRLKVFLYAAETLSFSEAAKRLHLTQPTVSHHIKVLERDLGVTLFDRTGTGLHLTEAGQLLLPWAHKLIHQSNEMQEMMASIQDEVVGHLRIACSTTSGRYLLPRLAGRFRLRHPNVRVTILPCTPEHVVPRLLEKEANLGVLSREAWDDGLESRQFFEDQIILIAPSDHPLVSQKQVELSDLLDVPMIILSTSSGTHQVMLAELGKQNISLDDLNIFLEVGIAEAAVECVAGGYGVAFVSSLAAARALKRQEVVEVPLAYLKLSRRIYMVRHILEVPNRAQEVFWGFIHDPGNAYLLRSV